MLPALRDDALTSTPTGYALRVGLPWIRSLPLACLRGIVVTVDGADQQPVLVRVGTRRLRQEDLRTETVWWFTQDRVVLEVDVPLGPGPHDVTVDFDLLIPYLSAGPSGAPLELPQHLAARLELDGPAVPSVSRDVA